MGATWCDRMDCCGDGHAKVPGMRDNATLSFEFRWSHIIT